MAKTRIKTTPTRMQKEALMASAAVTTTTNNVNEHAFKVCSVTFIQSLLAIIFMRFFIFCRSV